MYRKIFFLMVSSALLFAVAGFVSAQAPASMAYQGRLVGTAGDPVTAVSTVIFSIYADASGGTAFWAETLSVQPNDQGIFTVELGATHSLTGSTFDGTKRWLGLKVGADAEMTPRQFLTSSPYAISATNIADSSVTTGKIKDSSITQSKLASGVSLPPNGAAGGSLSGTYPDPGIAGGAVGTTQLADNAVSAAKIAANAVTNAKIADNAIATAQIAAGAVSAAKIADGAISTAKIADNSVNSAKVVDGSITIADILDEPGIARNETYSISVANSVVTPIINATISVPAAGYVIAQGYGYGSISGTTIGNLYIGIDSTSTSITGPISAYGFNDFAVSPSNILWGSLATQRVFNVSSAGNYTYYLNASRGTTGGTAYIFNPVLELMYVPKAWGAVTISTMGADDPQLKALIGITGNPIPQPGEPAKTDPAGSNLRPGR